MQKVTLMVALAAALTWGGSVWAQRGNSPQSGDPSQRAQAQTWTGTLVDASCKEKDPSGSCPASASTTAYGIVLANGQFFKFDDAGNSMASQQMQKAGTQTGPVTVSVSGSLEENTIKVQSVQIR
jgi:hypothetical protein